MSSNKRPHTDKDYSFESVPLYARKTFWSMFFIMLGFTFFSASMSVGATMGNGLDLSEFIFSVMAGGIILAIYTGVLGYIGCGTGLSFDLLARRSFGVAGSRLPSLLISLTQIGWFGVGVAMFAFPAAEVLRVTRVKELLSEGINVSFGHDDICDPWYPMGNGNLRDVVFMGLHVCQIMGYQDIMDSYRFITTNAARTLHVSDRYGLEPGKPASFIVLDAKNYYEALNCNSPVLLSYRNGNRINALK